MVKELKDNAGRAATALRNCRTNIAAKGGTIDTKAGLDEVASKILDIPSDKLTGVYVNNEVSYRKQVPPNSAGVCYLNSIGGMTYKSKTFDGTYDDGAYLNFTFEFETPIVLPTTSAYWRIRPVVVGMTDEFIRSCAFNGVFVNGEYSDANGNSYMSIGIPSGVQISSLTIELGTPPNDELYGQRGVAVKAIPRFTAWDEYTSVEGNEYYIPTEFYTGLRDAKPTAVKSYGANLYDESAITFAAYLLNGNNSYFEKTDEYFKTTMGTYNNFYPMQPFGVYLDVGTYTLSLDAFIPTGGAPTTDIVSTVWSYDLWDYSSSSGSALGHKYLSAFDTWERITLTVVITKPSTYYLAIQGRGDATQYRDLDVRYKNIRLTRATDSEYVPYRAHITNTLPTAITDKLGKGCSDTLYDEYSFVDKKVITRVGEGNFNQAYLDTDNFPDVRMCYRHPYFAEMDLTLVSNVAHPIKMPFFDDDKSISAINNDGELFYKVAMYSSNVYIYVPKTVFPDVSSFNAWEAQNPLKFVTKLASYTETPITLAPTDFDGLIEVEAGGYLEFVNDYGYPVPSTVTFSLINGGGTT